MGKDGRLAIPKRLLERIRALPGDEVRISVNRDAIVLRPLRGIVDRIASLDLPVGPWEEIQEEVMDAST